MRKFFFRVLIFVSPFIILSYPMDIIMSHFLKKTSACEGEFEVWNYIYSGGNNNEIVIYGSSRAWKHINPEILEDSLGLSSYNLGIDGHTFWLQYLRHIEYMKHNIQPKIIIHSVDVFTLHTRKGLYNMNQFLPYMLWNKNITKYTYSYLGFSSLDYKLPLFRYMNRTSALNTTIKGCFNLNNKPLRKKGFKGLDKTWNRDFKNAKKTRKTYLAETDTVSINLYKQFLDECKSKNIEVILVYTPEYIEGQKYVSNRNEIINMYKKIAKDYHLLFLDYSDHEISYNKQLFYNASHLNADGAEIFSRILAHDLSSHIKQNFIHKADK